MDFAPEFPIPSPRMKKSKSRTRASTPQKKKNKKSKAHPKTVAGYLAAVPEPARGVLEKMRAAIRSAAPPESTEIISYGIPAFKHARVLVWYAAFAGHCSLFPTAAVIDRFKDELQGFSTSKGTIHFPLDKPMPAALIKKIVRTRVEQVHASGARPGQHR
jgi:uncharacterized protein YdhG (YjbR/CyaY superfamily)